MANNDETVMMSKKEEELEEQASIEKGFEGKSVPTWQKQITVRAVMVSFMLSVLFTFIVMKLNLTTGAANGGVIAGLAACGVMMNIVSTASDLMQDFKTGYMTLASPKSMFVSQITGTAMGCVISACVFWLFYHAFGTLGQPGSEYPAPYALVYSFPSLLCGIILDQYSDIKVVTDTPKKRESGFTFHHKLFGNHHVADNVGTSAAGAGIMTKKEIIAGLKVQCQDIDKQQAELEERKKMFLKMIEGLEADEVPVKASANVAAAGEQNNADEDEGYDTATDEDEASDSSDDE
ncbi:unnamed protein product [Trifolium pratense]|uniref:Uncharacterized protein n=1 Tax=Trifolium pratense TaxID=57577 RepID=A0ACB0IA69_TRIPR|nr:unnamed protein product [Trifolium pratense]